MAAETEEYILSLEGSILSEGEWKGEDRVNFRAEILGSDRPGSGDADPASISIQSPTDGSAVVAGDIWKQPETGVTHLLLLPLLLLPLLLHASR